MSLFKTLIYIGILLISTLGISQNTHLFEKGKDSYKEGDYQTAIQSWEEILQNEEASANLYFNLGNAYYKLNQIGPAIYFYEKALQLSPNDSDIKNNLAFAENARIDSIEPLPQSVFSKWYQNVMTVFSYDGWAIVSILFSIGFVVLFLLYYFSAREKPKRLFFGFSIGMLFLMALCLTMAFLSFNNLKQDRQAIIFSEEVEIKSEPSLGGNSIFRLHEGTKVRIIAQDGDWYRIRLADGKDGWISGEKMKLL